MGRERVMWDSLSYVLSLVYQNAWLAGLVTGRNGKACGIEAKPGLAPASRAV
jgi:hypothetical protein